MELNSSSKQMKDEKTETVVDFQKKNWEYKINKVCHSFIGFFKRNLEGALNLINIYRKLRVYIVFSLINGSMYKATEVHFLKLRFQCPNMSIVLYNSHNRFIFQHKKECNIETSKHIFSLYQFPLTLKLPTWNLNCSEFDHLQSAPFYSGPVYFSCLVFDLIKAKWCLFHIKRVIR